MQRPAVVLPHPLTTSPSVSCFLISKLISSTALISAILRRNTPRVMGKSEHVGPDDDPEAELCDHDRQPQPRRKIDDERREDRDGADDDERAKVDRQTVPTAGSFVAPIAWISSTMAGQAPSFRAGAVATSLTESEPTQPSCSYPMRRRRTRRTEHRPRQAYESSPTVVRRAATIARAVTCEPMPRRRTSGTAQAFVSRRPRSRRRRRRDPSSGSRLEQASRGRRSAR